jgi:hypothetical protein
MIESFMAVLAQNFLSAVTGDAFGLLVEEEDASVHVVGNNPLSEAVQHMFQVIPVTH